MSSVVEHICFFNVEGDPTENFLDLVRSLKSLDGIGFFEGQLCFNKVLELRGANYTHVLHSRYRNKAALDSYFVHPSHQAVDKKVNPYIVDKFVEDWDAVPLGLPIKEVPWAARIGFIKLVDGVTEDETAQVLAILSSLRGKFPSIRQISAGKNFSARSKGFNLGFVAMFDNLEELKQLNGIAEFDAELRSSIAPFLSDLVIADVDFKG